MTSETKCGIGFDLCHAILFSKQQTWLTLRLLLIGFWKWANYSVNSIGSWLAENIVRYISVIAVVLTVVWKPPYCQQLISNIEKIKILMSKSFCCKKEGRWFYDRLFRIRFFVFVDFHLFRLKQKGESCTLANVEVVRFLFEHSTAIANFENTVLLFVSFTDAVSP